MLVNYQNDINQLITFTPNSYKDSRGYFKEIFKHNFYYKYIGKILVQDNMSFSKKNTVRGFHFQTNKPQGKLIFCLQGSFDLYVIDLRQNSKTYLNSQKFNINSNNHLQIYMPPGCANAVISKSSENILIYKCTEYWNPKSEKGFNFFNNDITKIKFNKNYKVSEKDFILPNLEKILGLYFKK